jgi:hypothetical protein
MSYSEKTPTSCVFPVFSVAVILKCCDAYGDGNRYFLSGFPTLQDDEVPDASTGVDRKSMRHLLGERSWKDADSLCISTIQSGGYVKVL